MERANLEIVQNNEIGFLLTFIIYIHIYQIPNKFFACFVNNQDIEEHLESHLENRPDSISNIPFEETKDSKESISF